MNTEDLIKSALTIVGITQMLKSFIHIKKGSAWTVITIMVGVGVAFIPSRFLSPILAIAGASLFYDTIFQTFEKVFKHTSQDEEK